MSKTKLVLEVVGNLKNLAASIEDLVQAVDSKDTEAVETIEKLPTLEEVRRNLALLSQSGKQAEVKALITKYGVSKLSDIPKEKYPELLKEAGEIE